MVEQTAVNRSAVGSSPTVPAISILETSNNMRVSISPGGLRVPFLRLSNISGLICGCSRMEEASGLGPVIWRFESSHPYQGFHPS